MGVLVGGLGLSGTSEGVGFAQGIRCRDTGCSEANVSVTGVGCSVPVNSAVSGSLVCSEGSK